MQRLHMATMSTIATIWEHRDERDGSWDRIVVIGRERGGIVMIVRIVTNILAVKQFATIMPIWR